MQVCSYIVSGTVRVASGGVHAFDGIAWAKDQKLSFACFRCTDFATLLRY